MTVIIVRGQRLADLAEQLGIPPAEATMSRVLACLTPAAGAAYAGRVKAAEIRSQALARDAAAAGRVQPEHAAEWQALAAAFCGQPADDNAPDGAR